MHKGSIVSPTLLRIFIDNSGIHHIENNIIWASGQRLIINNINRRKINLTIRYVNVRSACEK